jgi:CHASE3 domain sensor protein
MRHYDGEPIPLPQAYQELLTSEQSARHEARLARRALAGACLVIVLLWAIIIWLAWFRRPY